VFRQTHRMRHVSFGADVETLVKAVRHITDVCARAPEAPAREAKPDAENALRIKPARAGVLIRRKPGNPLAALKDILVVDDITLDLARSVAVVRTVMGTDVSVRTARSLGSALDCVNERAPDLVVVDDHLGGYDTAARTIPFMRRCGYLGPIVVVSAAVTRAMVSELTALGALAVLHKDAFDAVALSDILDSLEER
jgi:CheY-like chemotaxis protein